MFETGKTTFAKKLRFPQFTNKRVINNAKMYINPNENQKYKMIFGLDFLIANKFDFILSDEAVRWQGVEINIYNNDLPSNEKENNVIDKHMSDNNYEKQTGESVAQHKNASHLNNDEKGK